MANPIRPEDDRKRGAGIAVALGKRSKDGADTLKVVAQAKGSLAEEMRALASAHGIELRQDRDLAALLSAVELDHDIPVAALAAVSGILTLLFHANNQAVGRIT